MPKYRVLHVIDHLEHDGAQAVLLQLIGLRSYVFSCEVACLHGRGPCFETLEQWGVRVYSLSPWKLLPLHLVRFVWLLLTRRYDLVHFHLPASNLLFKPVARLMGRKVLISHDHCVDTARRRIGMRQLYKMTNRLSRHTVAVSTSIAAHLVHKEGVRKDKVSVVANGVDLRRFNGEANGASVRRRLGLPPEGRIVAGIGRLVGQKNFSLFIDVAATVLQSEDVTFVIAGRGKLEPELRGRVHEAGLEGRLRFLGFVHNMPGLYSAIDVLLSTSAFEGMPMALLEAMGSGVAIVAPRVDGFTEVLADEHSALLYEPALCDAAAEATLRLLRDPSLRAHLVETARERARELHSAQAVVASVENIYHRSLH